MEKGRFLIETHLGTGRPIAELAAAHGVPDRHRQRHRLAGADLCGGPPPDRVDDQVERAGFVVLATDSTCPEDHPPVS